MQELVSIGGRRRALEDSTIVAWQQQQQYENQDEAFYYDARDFGNYETFKKHLGDLVAEGPTDQTVQAIERASVVGRLMGLLRAQR